MKKLLVLFVAVCMLMSFCACAGSENTVNTDPVQTTTNAATTAQSVTESTASFKVTVVDGEGNPVSGVMLQICKDTCVPMMTDANGVAAFNMEITDGHKLSVLSCPEGFVYNGEAEVYMEDGATEYTVELDAQ